MRFGEKPLRRAEVVNDGPLADPELRRHAIEIRFVVTEFSYSTPELRENAPAATATPPSRRLGCRLGRHGRPPISLRRWVIGSDGALATFPIWFAQLAFRFQ
jgi:hypothetical protein